MLKQSPQPQPYPAWNNRGEGSGATAKNGEDSCL